MYCRAREGGETRKVIKRRVLISGKAAQLAIHHGHD